MIAPSRLRIFCAGAGLLLTAIAAQAQSDAPRLYVAVNGGVQTGGEGFTDRREFEVNFETAAAEARHPFEPGALVEGGLAVRLWRGLGAGVAVSRFSGGSAAAVDARIPHPFQFEAHREISGESGRARRSETGVHVQFLYHLPAPGRLRAMLFAGPSYVAADQDLVREVRYDESYPYDAATFASADLARASGSAVGFNAGVDAFWMFTTRLGAGVLVRFTRASLDLDGPADRRIGVDAGGVHVGVGARVGF